MLQSQGTLSLGPCSVAEAGENSLPLIPQHPTAAKTKVTCKLLGRAAADLGRVLVGRPGPAVSPARTWALRGELQGQRAAQRPQSHLTPAPQVWGWSPCTQGRKTGGASVTWGVNAQGHVLVLRDQNKHRRASSVSCGRSQFPLLQTVCDASHDNSGTENKSQTKRNQVTR